MTDISIFGPILDVVTVDGTAPAVYAFDNDNNFVGFITLPKT